jgi:hypothetical protein
MSMASEQDRLWAGSMPEAYDRWLTPSVFRPFAQDLARRAARLAREGAPSRGRGPFTYPRYSGVTPAG